MFILDYHQHRTSRDIKEPCQGIFNGGLESTTQFSCVFSREGIPLSSPSCNSPGHLSSFKLSINLPKFVGAWKKKYG